MKVIESLVLKDILSFVECADFNVIEVYSDGNEISTSIQCISSSKYVKIKNSVSECLNKTIGANNFNVSENSLSNIITININKENW